MRTASKPRVKAPARRRQPKGPIHPPTLPKLLYTKAEAAELLFSSVPTIERLIRRGTLRSLKVGRYRCIPASELEAFIAAQTA